jgi:hypothetical protein
MPQHAQRQQAHGGIDEPEKKGGPHQAQMRHQNERKQQRGKQRADVIEAEHIRDEVLERKTPLQHAEQQRDLQADKRTDEENDAVKRDAKGHAPAKQQKQKRRRAAAEQRDHELDADECGDEVSREESREP